MAILADGRPVAIKGDTIRLGQFLKVADAVDQGSDVKALLATEAVTVNGDVEVRRGRQLHPGDVVAVGRTAYPVVALEVDAIRTGGDTVDQDGRRSGRGRRPPGTRSR